MKRIGIVIFCMLSLFMLALAGNALAYNAAYTHNDYMSSTLPTINGQYAMGEEWIASATQTFGTNGIFRDEWVMSPVSYNILIETTDNTNDAGDYWVVCFDSTAEGGATEPNGGTAPKTDDYKVVVTGHGASATVQWYKGTGTAWATVASPSAANFAQAQSLSSSPKISAPHYILEMFIEKTNTELGTVIMGYNWAQYVAYFDAHAGGNGLQQWPPATATPPGSPDVPNSWGYIPYVFSANEVPDVPEGIGIAVMTAISTIALVAGTIYIRKRPKA
jgi:hypothetical protein